MQTEPGFLCGFAQVFVCGTNSVQISYKNL